MTLPSATAALARAKQEWPIYNHVAVDAAMTSSAGDLAWRFGLRAYDSVQLASAYLVHLQLGTSMVFCCFDKQLNAAAQSLNIQIAHP
jgi:predicted nucleic acid-binding protein